MPTKPLAQALWLQCHNLVRGHPVPFDNWGHVVLGLEEQSGMTPRATGGTSEPHYGCTDPRGSSALHCQGQLPSFCLPTAEPGQSRASPVLRRGLEHGGRRFRHLRQGVSAVPARRRRSETQVNLDVSKSALARSKTMSAHGSSHRQTGLSATEPAQYAPSYLTGVTEPCRSAPSAPG